MPTQTFLLVPVERVHEIEDLIGDISRSLLAFRGDVRGSLTLDIDEHGIPNPVLPALKRTTHEELAHIF